jgi:tetratricopeptide (TPR) repeat protein
MSTKIPNHKRRKKMQVLENTVTQAYELFTNKKFDTALEVLNNSEEDLQNELNNIDEDQREEFLASIQNLKGFINLGTGDYKAAQDCFENGLQLNPHSSQACAGLGEVLYLQEKDEEAKMMFEWALDLNSQNEFAKSGLVKVNQSLGLPNYHNSLEIDSMTDEEQSIFNKCITDAYNAFKEKDFQHSLEMVEKAQEILTSGVMSNSALIKIASLENFKGFNYLALEKFDADPRSSQACAGLGELYYLKSMDEESKTMFEFAVQHDPNNDFATAGLAKVNKALGLSETHNTKLNKEAI